MVGMHAAEMDARLGMEKIEKKFAQGTTTH